MAVSFLRKALRRDPIDRFQTPHEFRNELLKITTPSRWHQIVNVIGLSLTEVPAGAFDMGAGPTTLWRFRPSALRLGIRAAASP